MKQEFHWQIGGRHMNYFEGLKRQEYKAIVCETKDFNEWLRKNNIECEIIEEKDCWISVINNQ